MMSSDETAISPQQQNVYFGAGPKEELPSALRQFEENWRLMLDAYWLPNTWYLIWCQTYGVDPNTWHQSGVQYTGPQLDSLRFRTNLSRPNVRQSIMLALGERPAFEGVASNNDVSSLVQVPMSTRLVEYALTEAGLDMVGYSSVEADRHFGQGYMWMSWDVDGGEDVDALIPATDPDTGEPILDPNREPIMVPGKKKSGTIKLKRLFPWQVVTETFNEESGVCVVKEPISKWELAAQYPELADQILAVDNINDERDREMFAWQTACATTDLVILRHFYHESCAAVPGGRYTIFLEDIVLHDQKCPVPRGIPVVPVCTMRYFATSLGYPEASDLVAQQEVLDDVLSQCVNNTLKFGNESLWAEHGVDFDKDTVAEGGGFFRMGTGQNPPRGIQWAQMPEVAKFILEFIPGVMNQISGLNATALGKPEGNVQSGTAMALMVNVAERYQHATQATYDQALVRIANLALEFIRANADNGYAARVVGVGDQMYLRYFERQELNGLKSVTMKRRNPLMTSFPIRLETWNAIKDLPKDEKRAAVEMLFTGNMDALVEDDFSQTGLIRWENEEMLQGRPVQAMSTDDHPIHGRSHRATQDRIRSQPPPRSPKEAQERANVLELLRQHQMGHVEAWLSLDRTLGVMCGVPPALTMVAQAAGMAGGPAPGVGGGGGKAPALGGPDQKPKQPQLPEPAQQPPNANLQE